MIIGCLQFSPSLGQVRRNMDRVNAILDATRSIPELLVLPEMAFTGYNFPSLEAIQPYLEPTAAGPTTEWAIVTATRLNCHIIVGYPECSVEDNVTRNYNATVMVSSSGQVVNTYRKSFLYYTDETWASEGPNGHACNSAPPNLPFFCGPLPTLHPSWTIGHGVCMDINPYQFTAPWTKYEFANCMLEQRARLVVLSMAWLTRLLPHELDLDPERPDMETVAYWLERFWPFSHSARAEEIIVVFANRSGVEGNTMSTTDNGIPKDDLHQEASNHLENEEEVGMGNQVCYAGSSCVMQFQNGGVRMFERREGEVAIMGKGEEGLLVVDTSMTARFLLQQKAD